MQSREWWNPQQQHCPTAGTFTCSPLQNTTFLLHKCLKESKGKGFQEWQNIPVVTFSSLNIFYHIYYILVTNTPHSFQFDPYLNELCVFISRRNTAVWILGTRWDLGGSVAWGKELFFLKSFAKSGLQMVFPTYSLQTFIMLGLQHIPSSSSAKPKLLLGLWVRAGRSVYPSLHTWLGINSTSVQSLVIGSDEIRDFWNWVKELIWSLCMLSSLHCGPGTLQTTELRMSRGNSQPFTPLIAVCSPSPWCKCTVASRGAAHLY